MKYPLANPGIFLTVQGEGAMLGVPMVFVRLAGCSVGCAECDTDYRVASRATAEEITAKVIEAGPMADWVWLTGGEPTDYDLSGLVKSLRRAGFFIAMATAGVKKVKMGRHWGGVDFLSVSPHAVNDSWVQRGGDQVNFVPGLNNLSLADVDMVAGDLIEAFTYCYVTPLWGSELSAKECAEWVMNHNGWRLGAQAHKQWGLV